MKTETIFRNDLILVDIQDVDTKRIKGTFSLDRALELLSPFWTPLFGHHMRNRGGSAAKSQSFWVMLSRRDAPGPQIDMKELGRKNKRKRTTHHH